MKYKIKNTGEIIEVIQCDSDGNNIVYTDVKGCGNNPYLNLNEDCEPIIEDSIDWENRRYELAKAAMQAIINIQNYELGWDNNILCSDAINVSDELIKQLKSNEAK